MVDTLFGRSRVRRDLLLRFYSRPGVTHHVRELARQLGWSATIVGRELKSLERAGILRSERIGNVRRYALDDDSPVASDVRSLVQKTVGVEARLRDALTGLAGLEEAFLFGSYARGDDRATSDLDLMVIGRVNQEELSERLTDVERDLARDINVVSYERDEVDMGRQGGDRFMIGVVDGPRIQLIPKRSG
jgi:predicted nucleotidyltransferase